MKKVCTLLALCLSMQGCAYFGGGIIKSRTEAISDPKIGEKAAAGGGLDIPTNAIAYDAKWLETHWGKPASVHKQQGGSSEVWTYKFGLIWKGVVPVIILPVPIVLPFEREKVRFTLRDGHVVTMTLVTRDAVGGGFGGTLIGPCGPSGGTFELEDMFD